VVGSGAVEEKFINFCKYLFPSRTKDLPRPRLAICKQRAPNKLRIFSKIYIKNFTQMLSPKENQRH